MTGGIRNTLQYKSQFLQIEEIVKAAAESGSKNIKVVVTGSRGWKNTAAILIAVDAMSAFDLEIEAIHGNAQGADRMFASACRRYGVSKITSYPAKWQVHHKTCTSACRLNKVCRRAGYIRNQEMADAGPDICLSFNLDNSKGTSMMEGICKKQGIPVVKFSDSSY